MFPPLGGSSSSASSEAGKGAKDDPSSGKTDVKTGGAKDNKEKDDTTPAWGPKKSKNNLHQVAATNVT
eukprot:GSA25T00022103001.1